MTRARSTPTMGILAGMGPRSTAPFIDAVVDECQRQYGARHDIDFPPMMIFSLPAPFYLDRPIDHDALRSAIVDGVSRLASVGVDIIAVPCNSAQLYFEDLARAITVPMVSMTENAVAALDPGARRIALVATHATVRSGLYQALLHRAGKQVIARPELQADVDAAIAAAKSGDGAGAVQRWRGVMQGLAGLGCDAVLLACTDLAIAARDGAPCPVTDAGQVLARELVRRWRQLATTGSPRAG